MTVIATGPEQKYSESNRDLGVRLVPLQENMVGKFRPALLILMSSAIRKKLDLLGKEIAPLAIFSRAHVLAPELRCCVFQGHIRSHPAFRFCEPHTFQTVLVADG